MTFVISKEITANNFVSIFLPSIIIVPCLDCGSLDFLLLFHRALGRVFEFSVILFGWSSNVCVMTESCRRVIDVDGEINPSKTRNPNDENN